MTSQFSIGEQVAQLVVGIDAFYNLPQSTPLSKMIEARAFETRQRLARLQAKPSQAKPSQAKPSQAKGEFALLSRSRDSTPEVKNAWRSFFHR